MDARKKLSVLQAEWERCVACDLGKYRQAEGGAFVFGEGLPRGVMFVGEGPGWIEEREGRPFIGKSGALLRKIIDKVQVSPCYLTNVVTCRSCQPATDALGNPLLVTRGGKQMVRMADQVPPPQAVAACMPRLQEEIYLVDPIVIVTLGVAATSALTGRPFAITKERGEPLHISIPGAGFRPVLTEKKGVWRRKVHGEMVMPSEPNQVRYLVIPTLHPAFVLRNLGDQGAKSDSRKLISDIVFAKRIFERYQQELRQDTLPSFPDPVDDDEIERISNDLTWEQEHDYDS